MIPFSCRRFKSKYSEYVQFMAQGQNFDYRFTGVENLVGLGKNTGQSHTKEQKRMKPPKKVVWFFKDGC